MSNVTVDELMKMSGCVAAMACCVTCSSTLKAEKEAMASLRQAKAKLRSEIESLIKDRERLEYLFDGKRDPESNQIFDLYLRCLDGEILGIATIREAIDAAMSKTNSER